MSEGLRTRSLCKGFLHKVQGQKKTDVPDQVESKFTLLPFCSIQALKWLDESPPTLVRAISFTQSTCSNANLPQKNSNRHTHKNCFTSYLGIPWSSQHIKLTITLGFLVVTLKSWTQCCRSLQPGITSRHRWIKLKKSLFLLDKGLRKRWHKNRKSFS